jgi:hypothetical protein
MSWNFDLGLLRWRECGAGLSGHWAITVNGIRPPETLHGVTRDAMKEFNGQSEKLKPFANFFCSRA